MPAKAPPSGPKLKKTLLHLGQQIRARRKGLKISAVATAEAAGISRVTLDRIERGETSVTIGAYMNVISVLGLELQLFDPKLKTQSTSKLNLTQKSKISLSKYPQLKKLAWQIKQTQTLSPEEALNLYERNWRHIDLNAMESKELKLIQELMALFGTEKLLV
ncbi:MAG: helix-turn-helix domain-containing protein [Bdellovibrionaceae bacterium]|nr:helix-turn-helix domain-containing protein [Pseudobdellovibrionaceae bacterium]